MALSAVVFQFSRAVALMAQKSKFMPLIGWPTGAKKFINKVLHIERTVAEGSQHKKNNPPSLLSDRECADAHAEIWPSDHK